jgi:hypothetical protein
MSRRREAAELLLIARKSAARFRQEFTVDREKLGRFGGFSAREMDAIEQAVLDIEDYREKILKSLEGV